MATDSIVAQIDAEIARLTHVRALLSGARKISGAAVTKTAIAPQSQQRRKRVKRILSPEARERIAAAQKKRWAAVKAKAGKNSKSK